MEITPLQLRGVGLSSPRTRNDMVQRLKENGITNNRILYAMNKIPRHIFVETICQHLAYSDTALPIGFNQTISQPYTVALMSQIVMQYNPKSILEIGTGSGYQTAIYATLLPMVYSVERISALSNKAKKLLKTINISNTSLAVSDGFLGWPKDNPKLFDAISIAAAPEKVPVKLLKLLQPEGILISPVGPAKNQTLRLYQRQELK